MVYLYIQCTCRLKIYIPLNKIFNSILTQKYEKKVIYCIYWGKMYSGTIGYSFTFAHCGKMMIVSYSFKTSKVMSSDLLCNYV